jgi:serine phosphatase RsbU (regulator of sigma subunit)/anti-sigma regulatory factor (Ser/Thr protein kinase)
LSPLLSIVAAPFAVGAGALALAWHQLRTGLRIRRAKNHLQGVFDHVDPMVVVDRELRIRRLNRPFLELVGRTSFRELLGVPLGDVAVFLSPAFFLLRESMDQCSVVGPCELPPWDERVQEAQAFPLAGGAKAQAVLRLRDVTALSFARRELVDRNAALGRLTEALQGELEMAREIQQALLPKDLPRLDGLSFHVRYQPCRPVGGDLYDISLLDDHHLCLFLADVSGHGLPAAFEAALVRMSLLNHASADASPAEILGRMNHDLCRSLVLGHYVTAFLGILDLRTLDLRYCRASHPRPALFHQDGSTQALESKGMFLGIVEDGRYREDHVRLRRGDRLCLFTDGYYESATPQGRRLGYKSFLARLPASVEEDPEPVLVGLEREFPGMLEEERDDDRTFIAVDVLADHVGRPHVLRRFPLSTTAEIHSFSSANQAWEVIEHLRSELESDGWSSRDARRIQLLASELCVNSVTHGLRGRPRGQAFCAWHVQGGDILFSVHDEGGGFDTESLPDPREPSRLSMDHGRGVFLVRRISGGIRGRAGQAEGLARSAPDAA